MSQMCQLLSLGTAPYFLHTSSFEETAVKIIIISLPFGVFSSQGFSICIDVY